MGRIPVSAAEGPDGSSSGNTPCYARGIPYVGRSPARLLGWSSKFWSQLYRDSGTMDFVADGTHAGRLVLRDLPPCIAASRPYLLGMAAALGASFEMMDLEGEAQLGAVDVAAGSAEICVSWK